MTRYLGGLITKDESLVLPANNFEDTSAPGVWTLEEAQALNKQGLWPTAGNANPAKFIENVFSIDLYLGGVTTPLTITNNIDLSGEGGLVWIKGRTSAHWHQLADTERGANKMLSTNSSNAESSRTQHLTAFTSTGFTIGNDNDVTNPFIVAAGGTETTCGDCKIHTFTGPGTFTVTNAALSAANNIMSPLVVGGGAGG